MEIYNYRMQISTKLIDAFEAYQTDFERRKLPENITKLVNSASQKNYCKAS